MADLNTCAQAIVDVLGDTITKDEAKDVVKRLRGLARQIADSQPGLSLEKAMGEAAEIFTQGEARGAKLELRNKLEKVRILGDIKTMLDSDLSENKMAAYRLLQILGANKNRPGWQTGYGIDQISNRIAIEIQEAFGREVQAAGLWSLVNSRQARVIGSAFDTALYKELYNLDQTKGAGESVTGNKQVHELAKIIHKWYGVRRTKLNEVGADIRELDTFGASRHYSNAKVRALGDGAPKGKEKEASFAVFLKEMLPRLDHLRTFEGADPVDFLRSVHNNLYNGNTGKDVSVDELIADFDAMTSKVLPHGSMAAKLSQHRVLHFKNAGAAVAINKLIGGKSTVESFWSTMLNGAHSEAMMMKLGANPARTYQDAVRLARALVDDRADSAQQLALFDSLKVNENLMQDAGWLATARWAEKADRPAAYRWLDNLRLFSKVAKTAGSGIVSFFGDMPALGRVVSFNGVPWPQAFLHALASRLPQGADRIAYLRKLGAISEMETGQIMRGLEDSMHISNGMRTFAARAARASGLDWSTTRGKQQVMWALSLELSDHVGKSLDELAPALRASLERHGVGDLEWNILRAQPLLDVEGHSVLDPDAALKVSDERIDLFAKSIGLGSNSRDLERAKRELWTRIGTLFTDEAQIAVASPGADIRRRMRGTTLSDTASGQIVRMIGDLKTFGVASWTNIIEREFLARGHSTVLEGMGKNGAAWWAVSNHIAYSAIMAYFAWSAKEMIKGRTPPPLVEDDGTLHIGNISQSIMRGGGFGIAGDFLLAEYDQRTGGLLGKIAGPVPGDIGLLAQALSKAVRPTEEKAPVWEVQRLIEGNTPLLNLPYLRPLLNYLVLYNLQEMLQPDAFDRHRRKLYEATGQETLEGIPGFMAPPWERDYLRPLDK